MCQHRQAAAGVNAVQQGLGAHALFQFRRALTAKTQNVIYARRAVPAEIVFRPAQNAQTVYFAALPEIPVIGEGYHIITGCLIAGCGLLRGKPPVRAGGVLMQIDFHAFHAVHILIHIKKLPFRPFAPFFAEKPPNAAFILSRFAPGVKGGRREEKNKV